VGAAERYSAAHRRFGAGLGTYIDNTGGRKTGDPTWEDGRIADRAGAAASAEEDRDADTKVILKMKADTLLKEFKTVEYSWLTKKAPPASSSYCISL